MLNEADVLRRLFRAGLCIAVAFGVAALLIVVDGLNDELGKADVAIVLGNAVDSIGQPSARLQARLDTAVALYQRGPFTQVIVSGGVGAAGFDEAVVMQGYLMAQGLPASSIWVDSAGNTTDLTVQHAAQMMKTNGWRSALVISQYFHIARCKLALQRYGITLVFAAHANFFEPRDIYSVLREVAGYLVYLLRPVA